MTDLRPLNIAVVGAGFAHSVDGRENWGVRTHLPALKSLPQHYNVVAICTSRLESAKESAARFDVPHAFDEFRALMDLPGLDAVSVVVRPRLHFPVVMAALEAGKHVYCEWPLALNAKEAAEMAALADKRGVITGIGTQGHFWPAAERMRKLVRDGYIGRPLAFGAAFFVSNYIAPRPAHRQWLFQSSEGGNAAYRAGHMLERIVSTLGEVTAVSADLSTLVPERPVLGSSGMLKGDQVDNMNFLLQLVDGVHGTLQASYTAWFGTGQRFEVYGTDGMLMLARQGRDAPGATGHNDPGYLEGGELFGARVETDKILRANQAPETLLQDIQPIDIGEPPDLRESGLPPYGSAYVVRRAFKAFAEAIAASRRFDPDFSVGLHLHQVLECAEHSNRERRWITPSPSSR